MPEPKSVDAAQNTALNVARGTAVAATQGTETGARPGQSVDDAGIVFEQVSFAFDDHVVLRDVSFTLPRGRMMVLLGASGSGKSVILKLALGLLRPDAGRILVNGHRVDSMTEAELMTVRADVGMLFQESALFDSLSVEDNVGYRLYEEMHLPVDRVRERVEEVLGFVGLSDFITRMPSELSGGQRRRVAIARAMASKPEILLFDDPTSGLDPITATSIDDEIVKLRDLEGVTSIVVTHTIRDAFYIATHRAVRANGELRIEDAADGETSGALFLMLHEGRISFEGSAAALRTAADSYLREFLFMTLPPW